MKIYIKNMVCDRCKMVIQSTLEKFDLEPIKIDLGEVTIAESTIDPVKEALTSTLQGLGFDLLDDKNAKTIEQIKLLIINLIQQNDNQLEIPLSDFLSRELQQDYSALSNLFSSTEGLTIEKYYILQKVEKVKELLKYDELSLAQIASKLNYSSAAYLSNQFKKVTGLTPSHFKTKRNTNRKSIDDI